MTDRIAPGGVVMTPDFSNLPRKPTRLFSPLQISMVLHAYAIAEPMPLPSTEHREQLAELETLGLVTMRDKSAPRGVWQCTEFGNAWVEMLMRTPLPERRFVDPRTGGVVSG